MSDIEQVLQIQLEDGRILIGTPGPEDQPWLRSLGSDTTTIELGASGYDTSGHGLSADIDVDVAGHAMTLRLPTPADAEALRKLLVVGAMSATIVAAGAIASMQPQAVPSTQSIVNPVHAPVPAQDFAQRRETAIDEMLGAPPMAGSPSDIVDDNVHSQPAVGGASVSAAQQAAANPSAGSPSDDFAARREQAADDLLQAPQGAAGNVTQADGPTHGGPQD
jgi:hypothetical protein